MWLLNAEQTNRLTALQRGRDLARIGGALAAVFPEARGKLADRFDDFIAHGAQRAGACGLTHLLCISRYLACWVACGADFESRQPWAAAILTDRARTQGAKAYQLCVRVQEQLRSAPQPGQPAAADFAAALTALDQRLAAAGTLASLLPPDRITLGAACDLDAVDVRLVNSQWRQHYTALNGPWRREECAPAQASITLTHNAAAEGALALPEQITLLSRPPYSEHVAKLRVRVKAEHRCDNRVHPLVECIGPSGVRALRGEAAADATFSVSAEAPEYGDGLVPHIGEESSPELSQFHLASCGLRARGVPVGELNTLLAAYDAAQYLLAWRHEAPAAWTLPADTPPAPAEPKSRFECDGQALDTTKWQSGLRALDEQLQQGLARLFTGWERESGVSSGQLAVEAALLSGTAGITWGWAEGPMGIAQPPYMRMEALFDLVACRLGLRLSGQLARGGSRSLLTLSTEGQALLRTAWQRGHADTELFMAVRTLQVPIYQAFDLALQPVADAGLAVMSRRGPLRGAITGAAGLGQRPDGPGLRWFVRLAVEPVVAPLRLVDPLLGVQEIQQPLLPAMTLVDWSMA